MKADGQDQTVPPSTNDHDVSQDTTNTPSPTPITITQSKQPTYLDRAIEAQAATVDELNDLKDDAPIPRDHPLDERQLDKAENVSNEYGSSPRPSRIRGPAPDSSEDENMPPTKMRRISQNEIPSQAGSPQSDAYKNRREVREIS